jgi:hypothetical protein
MNSLLGGLLFSTEKSIEKKKIHYLQGLSSSLNRSKSERQRKGVRMKKGLVGIIRSDS